MSALDFSGLLQAVEQLIQSHGNKSKYSEVIDAKIVAKNGDVYTVQAGNDEFSAKAIDGTSSYPLESLVCVLITNNTQASVINYILGLKEQDSSKDYSSLYYRVIAEVTDSVVTSSNEVVLLASKGWGEIILYQKDGEDNKITLQETDDFKFFIREYGILKMRGSFKNTFSPTNIGKGTFGLKIDINFGDSESKNYLISNYDMLGDPYRYKDYSEQELSFELGELYKQNFNYIEKISFYAIDFTAEEGEQGDSISLTDISIYAGELQSIIKDLKLELKVASAPVDSFYGDSSTVTLQANLTSENGGSYNFSEMRYFWFIKDTSVNSQSEYFSSIAGAGWRCLNQKMPYEVNGVTYQNWIGTTDDLFILTKENAPSRKNTYKCFGVYKGDVSKSRNLISNEIEIINYNKVDFILNIESTSMNFETLDDSITLTAVVSASPQPKTGYEYFYEYKWFEAGVEMMDETDVSITVQPKEKSPIQTYSCKVDCYSKDTSTDEKIFLATIEKEISLNNLTADGELITETVYYWKETTAAPDAPEKDMVYGDGEGKDNWNTNNSIESPASKYRFKSERKVLLKKAEDGKREWAGYEKDSEDQGKYYRKEEDNIYYYSTKGEGDTYIFTLETMDSNPTDWSNPVCDYVSGAYNLETAVAQLNIFNQLTENGKDDGIYYSENDEMGYQLTKDETWDPEKTYYKYDKDNKKYIVYEKPEDDTANNTPTSLKLYEYKNRLYINATYIKAGTLIVEDDNNKTIFKASVNEKTVTIGGWEVDSYRIFSRYSSGASLPKVGISSSGAYAFWAGVTGWSNGNPNLNTALFRVDFGGNLYATNADITGKITATSGYIGLDQTGWKIAAWEHPTSKTKTAVIQGNYKTAATGTKTDRAIQIVLRVPNAYGNSSILEDGTTAESRNEVLTVSNYYKDTNGDIKSEYPFVLYSDGTLNATKANITGEINATGGKIGDLTISDGGISTIGLNIQDGYINATNLRGYSITARELEIDEQSGVLKTPKISTYFFYDLNESGYIKAGGSSALKDFTATISKVDSTSFKITLASSKTLSKNQTFKVKLCRTSWFGGEGSPATGEVEMSSGKNNQTFKLTEVKYSTGNSSFFTSSQPFYSCYFMQSDSSSYNFQQLEAGNPGFQVNGNFEPNSGNTWLLGASNQRWKGIYLYNSPDVVSDKNEKKNITLISSQYSNFFDKLNPVSYKFIQNDSDRIHIGFIAQDVEQSLLDVGLTTKDFAGVCYWDKEDGTKGYSLRYEEFIALNTMEIQKLKARVAELEKKLLQFQT